MLWLVRISHMTHGTQPKWQNVESETEAINLRPITRLKLKDVAPGNSNWYQKYINFQKWDSSRPAKPDNFDLSRLRLFRDQEYQRCWDWDNMRLVICFPISNNKNKNIHQNWTKVIFPPNDVSIQNVVKSPICLSQTVKQIW